MNKFGRKLLGAIAAAALLWASGSAAQDLGEIDKDLPVLLKADEVSHDQELGIIVARGNVEIAQGERVMLADTISYNQRTETVTATGSVKILEPTGDVFFADYVELTDQMRDGAIANIRILMAEGARIVANGARRTGGNRTTMAKGVYSPCEVCKDDPTKAPLWQVKAQRIVHDQQEKQVEYHNASLEMFGIPVAYTPYLTHPDPTVKRKTGFLVPSFGDNSNNGTFLRVPYFWTFGEDKDATFDPILTTEHGPILSGEYRQRFNNGELEMSASLGMVDQIIESPDGREKKNDQVRGHIFAKGRFDIDETWRTGFDVERSTDQTYLRKLGFFEQPGNTLTSNAFVEGFRGRNYMAANAYTFQDLRTGQRDDQPYIFPLLDYNGLGEIDRYGGRWNLDANFRHLRREDSADSVRTSVIGGYQLPVTADAGYVTTFAANLRTDLYHMNQNRALDAQGDPVEDGFAGRFHPQASVDWRYPFARETSMGQQMIEPIAAIYVAPNGGNPDDIINEDSAVVEEDDTNLFSQDRIPGLDRIEGGSRVAYGVKMSQFFGINSSVTGFLGQSVRLRSDDSLGAETGLKSSESDYLGYLDLAPHDYLDILYRFQVDHNTRDLTRNEIGFRLGSDTLNLVGDYTHVKNQFDPETDDIEEIDARLNFEIDDYWRGSAFTTRDMLSDGGSLRNGMSLTYEDECFILASTFQRTYTRDSGVEPSDSIFFTLVFKTLGEVRL